MNFKIEHAELADANDFVFKHHRHHDPVAGHRFSIAASFNGEWVGVAIVGRPKARMTDRDKTIVEVNRVATNGARNACSFLYGACARAAKALGYARIQTFILESESGTSLKAAGWHHIGDTEGGSWPRESRPYRNRTQPEGPKQKWGIIL